MFRNACLCIQFLIILDQYDRILRPLLHQQKGGLGMFRNACLYYTKQAGTVYTLLYQQKGGLGMFLNEGVSYMKL